MKSKRKSHGGSGDRVRAAKMKESIPSVSSRFVDDKTRLRLKHLVSSHTDSFSFMVERGIDEAVNDMPSLDMKLSGGKPIQKIDDGIDSDSDEEKDEECIYIRMGCSKVQVASPARVTDEGGRKFTPREARERGLSYTGAMVANFNITIDSNDEPTNTLAVSARLGELPIMVMSEKCNLLGLNAKQLVDVGEEANEMGGYFIQNGIERIVRLLQVPHRNHAMAIQRSSYTNRGNSYSDLGVTMRCVRPDQTSITMTMHYLNNGGATIRFVCRKQEFLLPVVLLAKCLADITDKELFDRVLQGDEKDTFASTRMELLLRDGKDFLTRAAHEKQGKGQNFSTLNEKPAAINTSRDNCLSYLGTLFRGYLPISDRTSDREAGEMLVQRYIFIHVTSSGAKLECLIHMLRKLFAFAQGKCDSDNADALMNHEILLPGHLINMQIKEKIEECILNIKGAILRDYRFNKVKCLQDIQSGKYFQKQFDRFGSSIGPRVGTFLSTGNLVSSSGLDLMQVSGFTVVAERLNIFRYMSHFQAVHRGQFFTTMKTTAVRKLLPESWGFMCPVHTPDGSPCGLLNHMARDAVILSYPTSDRLPTTPEGELPVPSKEQKWVVGRDLRALIVSLGVTPAGAGGGDGQFVLGQDSIPVLIDGEVIGGISVGIAANVTAQLRLLKIKPDTAANFRLDPTTQLAYFPPRPNGSPGGGAFPGLYIFTQPGRMLRQVTHLATRLPEWIGPMEQAYMEIACLPNDIRADTTHVELSPDVMLSQIAALTPFSDCNQSPRNMYQCQMGKQTMGTACHAWKHRTDNKMYRIQNPQAPLVQNQAHSEYMMDEYPQGTNAVVAVIAYTGFDMEDAMIINKAAYERGFGHGSVYKTKNVDLEEEEKRQTKDGTRPTLKFGNLKSKKKMEEEAMLNGINIADVSIKFDDALDIDGLPFEGEVVNTGDPIACIVNVVTGDHFIMKHKDGESAFVDTIRVLGKNTGGGVVEKASRQVKDTVQLRKVSMTFRYRRNPIIGDKFSSRHGQKGTLGVLWPQHDMPFSESGMSPDILINPHAFPSRMTIGMLIESMAAKAGAMHGRFQDSTPFRFHEENKVIDHYGEQLTRAGYHYYGSEPLYNGITGVCMQADIFLGPVYYQRLRHMVSDKSQARSTGAVMAVTRQPVKGRKRHGGIRLGEMERDALLSHGVAFCVQDRLLNCSDAHIAHICGKCGNMLNVTASRSRNNDLVANAHSNASGGGGGARRRGKQYCNMCDSDKGVRPVVMPYVFRYLVNELAGMGIKLKMALTE